MNFIFKIKLSFFFILATSMLLEGQLKPAACIHSHGFQFLSDAFLGSLGACDCQKATVYLNGFPPCNNSPYELEFEEDFNGDSLDLSKWQNAPWQQGSLIGNQHVGVSTLANVELRKGLGQIIAKKEKVLKKTVDSKPDNEILEDGKQNLRSFDYTWAIIFSRKTFYHGKYEIRCKLPKGNGLWPGFWMYGGTRGNEIDVIDSAPGNNDVITNVLHNFELNGNYDGCTSQHHNGFDLSEWHTYTCIFDPDKIIFLIDDKITRIVYRIATLAGKMVECGDELGQGSYFQLRAFPVEAMHIILSFAILSENGPAGSKPVDDSTPFPSSFEIDYVRMWKRSADHFEIYPNPATEKIQVSSKNSSITSLQLCNLNGTVLYNAVINNNSAQMNLSAFPDGIYSLSIKYNGGRHTQKVVKITR